MALRRGIELTDGGKGMCNNRGDNMAIHIVWHVCERNDSDGGLPRPEA